MMLIKRFKIAALAVGSTFFTFCLILLGRLTATWPLDSLYLIASIALAGIILFFMLTLHKRFGASLSLFPNGRHNVQSYDLLPFGIVILDRYQGSFSQSSLIGLKRILGYNEDDNFDFISVEQAFEPKLSNFFQSSFDGLTKGEVIRTQLSAVMKSGEEKEFDLLILPSNDLREVKQTAVLLDSSELETLKQLTNKLDIRDFVFANLSHEVKSPLNAILGFTEITLNDSDVAIPDIAKIKENLRNIFRSSKYLESLVGEILSYEEIYHKNLTANPTPVNISELVQQVMKLHELTAMKRNIRLTSDTACCVDKTIMMDVVKCSQVLNNLITNALKYCDAGEVHVKLSLKKQVDTAALLVISVTDTGRGIPQDELSVIFEPFAQSSQDPGVYLKGSGLGLFICKAISAVLAGRLSVTSKVGVGSTFTFEVPTKIVETKNTYTVNPNSRNRDVMFSSVINVLVADDDALNRKFLGRLLTSAGANVTLAIDGKDAIDNALAEYFDIVLLDINMPTMDGIEATKHIRKIAGYEKVPIYAVSAGVLKSHRDKVLEAGMNDFIPKPVNSQFLLNTIASATSTMLVDSGANHNEEASLDKNASRINFVKALDFWGSNSAHVEALKDFIEEYKDFDEQFFSSSSSQALKLAHKLKGVAGLVGCDGYVVMMEKLEDAMQSEDCRDTFKHELTAFHHAVLNDIHAIIQSQN
jgi:signal transduction histidine kinase/CheY-like chemotaxis protein/HPt (histidine-containing phosphotransfer) domain-containing protein